MHQLASNQTCLDSSEAPVIDTSDSHILDCCSSRNLRLARSNRCSSLWNSRTAKHFRSEHYVDRWLGSMAFADWNRHGCLIQDTRDGCDSWSEYNSSTDMSLDSRSEYFLDLLDSDEWPEAWSGRRAVHPCQVPFRFSSSL